MRVCALSLVFVSEKAMSVHNVCLFCCVGGWDSGDGAVGEFGVCVCLCLFQAAVSYSLPL